METKALGMGDVKQQSDQVDRSDQSKETSQASHPAERGNIGDDQRPVCPVHYCMMVASSSKSETTLYKCKVNGCKETEKKIRPFVSAPRDPHYCPYCANGPQQNGKGKKVALEVDIKASRFNIKLRCPSKRCDFTLEVPRLPEPEKKVF